MSCRGRKISEGFFERVDKFLEISARHGIRPMVVLFDGVWDPDPQSGPQRRPRTGVHNSGWVQSPGRVVLADAKKQDALKPYVTDVIKRYADDDRVLAWDLFNEPDNPNANSYGPLELKNKDEVAARLVGLSFEWARAAGPKQPLTVGVWRLEHWDQPQQLNQVHRAAVELSDIISFHDYGKTDVTQRRIAELKTYGRPLLCTEFMARGNGSTFEGAFPFSRRRRLPRTAGASSTARRTPNIPGPPGRCRFSASQTRGITRFSTRMASRTAKRK